jgi:hypothetical protein
MGFYVDLLLEAKQPSTSLSLPLDVVGYEVGIATLAFPKTFSNQIQFIQVAADFVTPQYNGRKTLLICPVHDSHRSSSLIYEKTNVQYRPMSCTSLQNIAFRMLDQNDNPVQFDSGMLLIVLHFK